jgi:hypothetical protein
MPSFSLHHPPSPARDPTPSDRPTPDSDNEEDQVDAGTGVWKRRYFVLQEKVNAQTASKRKAE